MKIVLGALIFTGLFLWLIWYLFFRSVFWVAAPLIEYFKDREAERFSLEDIEQDEFDENDLEGIPKSKVKITVKDFDKPIHLSKSLLQKAQKEPQKLVTTNLWIYKDYIFGTKPSHKRVKEILDKGG